jgi:quercetin dioxygenase-like cupin family protein
VKKSDLVRTTVVIATSGWIAACASVNIAPPRAASETAFIAVDPARRESLAAAIAGTPMKGQNIVRRQLAGGSETTVFLVRIADREQPHKHTVYDLTVMVVEGSGTLWLDGVARPMARGDVAHVPRGVQHHFVNGGKDPASALVVFGPKFAGPDSEPTAP